MSRGAPLEIAKLVELDHVFVEQAQPVQLLLRRDRPT